MAESDIIDGRSICRVCIRDSKAAAETKNSGASVARRFNREGTGRCLVKQSVSNAAYTAGSALTSNVVSSPDLCADLVRPPSTKLIGFVRRRPILS